MAQAGARRLSGGEIAVVVVSLLLVAAFVVMLAVRLSTADGAGAAGADGGSTPTGTAAPLGGVAWDGLRPATRPNSLVPVSIVVQSGFAGPRPPLRPSGIAADPPPTAGDAAAPPADQTPIAAPGPADVTAALVAIVAAAPDQLAGATAHAVALARRPDTRPQNFDRVVTRAQDRIARARIAAARAA